MKHFRTAYKPLLAFVAFVVVILPFVARADGSPYLPSPIKCEDAFCLFLQIIRFFLAGVAIVSTVMFVWGGFVFLTSAGNPELVKKGKDILLWSTVGIVVILGSWVLIQYLLKGLVGAGM